MYFVEFIILGLKIYIMVMKFFSIYNIINIDGNEKKIG